MSLEALPGPTGGLMSRHLGQRPCTYNPPQWWDLGSPCVGLAVELCEEECPTALFRQCEAGPPVKGMVKAGVLYDDEGRPVKQKCRCGECRQCKGVVADHHNTIAMMRTAKIPFRVIAERIGFTEDATRVYWHSRGKHREAAKAQAA